MFEPDRLYLTDDPNLLAILKASTLASWRCEGRGPVYMKIGKRVYYKGADLNAFIDSHRVDPAAAA